MCFQNIIIIILNSEGEKTARTPQEQNHIEKATKQNAQLNICD